ncbi:restriction endonuclease subunit S [Tenacibaculum maritimum]|uniref:restriction endonuclease subunit S n=1 Tax=Tenacibaculum maritimum TaxID=107401 RepID=UPI003875F6E0
MMITKTIDELSTLIKTGKTPSTKDKLNFEDGEYNWFTPGDFRTPKILKDSKRKITEYAVKNSAVIYQPNTILITCIGDIGNTGIIKKEASENQQITGIVVDSDIIIPEFFLYWVKANKQRIQDEANQAVVPIINNKGLKRIKVTFPSDLPTQKKIVTLLDKASALLQKREINISLLDELINAQFLEMFGDPFFNTKNWTKKTFEEYIDYIGDIGSNGSNAVISKNLKMSDEESYALMVRTTNLKSDDFSKNVKYVSEETYNFFKKSKIYGGEIIMNKIGSAGEFWLMPDLKRPVSLGLNQFVIRTKNINHLFVYNFYSTEFGKGLIKSKTKGAVTKSITKSAVKKLPILVPPIELQNQFERLYINIKAQKQTLIQSKTELENLYNSLLQRAFSGQLNFNVDIELDALLASIDLEQDTEKEKHDIKEITTVYAGRLLERLEEQKFENQTQYQQAKQVVFQMLEQGIAEQAYDENTEAVKLKLV